MSKPDMTVEEYREIRAQIREELIAIAEVYAARIAVEARRAGAVIDNYFVNDLTLNLRAQLSGLSIPDFTTYQAATAFINQELKP